MLLLSLLLAAVSPGDVAAMRWEKRVLLVSASGPDDAALAAQRRIVARWKAGAVERDLALVEIIGDRVTGASDAAAALRRRYRLSPRGFTAVLIGKDGGSKLRARAPIAAATLEETIDAMPMRRAGGR